MFSGTYADITAQNGSLNSGSFVFMHTPMLEFLAAPHFGYELTAWTVNGNAITSGIEQKPEEKQLCKLTGPITADQTVVVTAAEIPQYDFTLSVDSLGDEGYGGTVSAEITRKGMRAYEQENLEAGTHQLLPRLGYHDHGGAERRLPRTGLDHQRPDHGGYRSEQDAEQSAG